ncbi:MAG: M24 family metallopeptidase [Chloroflexi bacterium]|nr:M24 family metallopeptidase [Chloroflexota bacterium]
MNIVLKHVPLPEFQFSEEIPAVSTEEYERRLTALVQAAETDWVLVFADREHSANLTWLVNYDPRFEEGLLVLGPKGQRTLIVGNEGLGYLPILRVLLHVELCQTFSLNSQPRSQAPRLKDVLAKIGLSAGQSASLVGWKYLEAYETDEPTAPAFIPAFFVDVVRSLLGSSGKLVDQTTLLMHPETGLRNLNSADQIAAFEWAARTSSASVFSIVTGTRPGMSEMQAMQLMLFAGQPLSMHPIFVSGKGEINGLRSPSSKIIEYGDAVSTGLGYWGSLSCRAGMMLGEPDISFFEKIAAPYFGAVASWYQAMRIGAMGKEVFQSVAGAFEGSGLHALLNPGHLTSYEEWTSSPIRPDSIEKIHSGMVFQSDIIPTPLPAGWLMNCEDTVAVADASLRAELKAGHPELWARVQSRRQLMTEVLGIQLAEEMLPLTDGTAYLPPFWLANEIVCSVSRES